MVTEKGKVLYTKEKLLKIKRYENRADLLKVLLEDGAGYTFEQTDRIIADFLAAPAGSGSYKPEAGTYLDNQGEGMPEGTVE